MNYQDIATQAGSNLTALASDEPEGNVFVAGFGDGVVRLFDKRVADAASVVVRTWRKHHTWIQSVHLQRGGHRELISGRCVASSSLPCQLRIATNLECMKVASVRSIFHWLIT